MQCISAVKLRSGRRYHTPDDNNTSPGNHMPSSSDAIIPAATAVKAASTVGMPYPKKRSARTPPGACQPQQSRMLRSFADLFFHHPPLLRPWNLASKMQATPCQCQQSNCLCLQLKPAFLAVVPFFQFILLQRQRKNRDSHCLPSIRAG